MFETDLFPAQVLFLQKPKKLKVPELFSAILQDLTLRKVLNLEKINSFPTERSKKTQKYFFFNKGENFEGYEPQRFEKYFLSPFTELNQVQSKSLTNYVLKRYALQSGFITDEVYAPLSKAGYVNAIPLMKGFGLFSLSSKGKEIANAANEFLEQQEGKLLELIDGDKEQFINTMKETGNFVFQIEHSNPDLYHELLSMVKRIYRTQPLGPENDLTEYYEAMNIDLGYFDEH